MPLQQPNLDDRKYADLVADARGLIPVYDPDWTDHNPADPGITLVELFAYLTEMLFYRLDRVTAENQRKFLGLLNGPGWKPESDLATEIRMSINAVRARERAVTTADFERLAIEDFNGLLVEQQHAEEQRQSLQEWWQATRLDSRNVGNQPSYLPEVGRAFCLASRNLERATEAERKEPAPGHVSLIVLPKSRHIKRPTALKAALWSFLDQWRTLTTRHHVVDPFFVPIRIEAIVATDADVTAEKVTEKIVKRLSEFLDPYACDGKTDAGKERPGWPFGRDVYTSELYEQIESVEGIDYVTDIMIFSASPAHDADDIDPLRWNSEGDLVGLAIERHQLPLLRGLPKITAAANTSFVPVQASVSLHAKPPFDEEMLKREAKRVVRAFFHPHSVGSGWQQATSRELTRNRLLNELLAIPGVSESGSTVVLQADRDRLLPEGKDQVLRLERGEIVNWRTHVEVCEAVTTENKL